MPLQFGQKPTSERVFVRVQHLNGEGKVTKTESMNVWQVDYHHVVNVVTAALQRAFDTEQAASAEEVEEAPVPIKGRVRRGRKA